MKRTNTKLGDVFSVRLDGNTKKYFQYIANDLTQLNSDVIRGFRQEYGIYENPDLFDIIQDKNVFYAHCLVKSGVKMGLWEKIGNHSQVGNLTDILFKGAKDYARKADEEPIKVSEKWYVWRINDDNFTNIGKLEKKYKDAYVGLVINPKGIIELLKGINILIIILIDTQLLMCPHLMFPQGLSKEDHAFFYLCIFWYLRRVSRKKTLRSSTRSSNFPQLDG